MRTTFALTFLFSFFGTQSIVQANGPRPSVQQKVDTSKDLGEWQNVLKLRKGKRIEVTSRDGAIIRGKLRDSTAQSVTIRNEITQEMITWRKEDIQQIKEPRMETPKPLGVGMAIGTALGSGIGAAVAGGKGTSNAAIPIGAAMGAVGGALLGDAYSKHHKGKVIYVANP
ncbi:MAG TPA: hypothetical protein VGL91_00290 [Acidobacteriota bacterium]|jgi:hypothetical protein